MEIEKKFLERQGLGGRGGRWPPDWTGGFFTGGLDRGLGCQREVGARTAATAGNLYGPTAEMGEGCRATTCRGRQGFRGPAGPSPRHEKLGEHPAEDARDGQAVDRAGGEDGDGVPQFIPHVDLQPAQGLALLHRGLHVLGQR